MKKLGKDQMAIIECKVGNFVQTGKTLTGQPKLRQMTAEEMEAMDATDSEPCDCKICTKRRENSTIIALATGLRSGKKLG